MSYYVGQKLRLMPNVHVDRLGHLVDQAHPCTIITINREHRYFRVEFDFPGGKIRESYKYADKEDLAGEVRRWQSYG